MRPYAYALLICCLIGVVGGYFVAEYQRNKHRHETWQRDRHVQDVLGKRVRIIFPDANQCSLLEAVQLLREQLDVPLDLESRLEGVKIYPGCLVSEQGTLRGIYDASLDEILEEMLTNADSMEGVVYELEEGRIVIQRGDDFSPAVLVREYETPVLPAGLIRLDETDVKRLICTSVDPHCWDDWGGPYTASLSPGGVTVAASSQVHRKISLMLEQLAQLPAEPKSFAPVAFLEAGYPYDLSQPPSPILRKLDQVGDFEYAEQPLLKFLGSISERFDIPILLEPKKLEEAAMNLETPITGKMTAVTLRTFLRSALSDLNLTYTLQPRGLVVTTPEDAGSQLISLLYPVHDLLTNPAAKDSQDFLEAITWSVVPDSWDDVGGPGSLELIADGWLLVWQTQESHEQLPEYLNRLRHDVPRTGREVPELSSKDQTARRMQAILSQPRILDLKPLPLRQFADALGKRLEITVSLAKRWLDEAAVNPDDIEICLGPQPQLLWQQLDGALQPYQLSFVVEDGFLVITTEEEASAKLTMEIVDTRDLIVLGNGHASNQLLVRLLQHSVDHDTWDDFGGPGSISSFRDSLIVFQGRREVFEIREFLSWLRAHRSELPTLSEIAALDKQGTEYLRLVAQSQSNADHWRAVYLGALLNPKLPEIQPNQKLVWPWFRGGGGFF